MPVLQALDKGTFRIPTAPREGTTALAINERALDDLLDGIDLVATAPAAPRRRPTTH